MPFLLTFFWRALVFAMRDRDGANDNKIPILVFSIRTKEFPHEMLLYAIRTLGGLVTCKQISAVCCMPYTVTSDTVGLAIGPASETANDVHEALSKASQMYETGMVNISIEDQAGHKIEGDELLECITGKKMITEDLRSI